MPQTKAPHFDAAFRDQLDLLLSWRRDVRAFEPVPVGADRIEALLQTAMRAPSVGLSQPWRFLLVESEARRADIRRNFKRCNAAALAKQQGERAALYAGLKLAGLDDAPVHIAVFADHATAQGASLGRMTMPETVDYSAVLAVHTLWLAARAEGLGVGWVSILDTAELCSALDVPAEWRFIAYLCIGTPRAEDDVPALERAGWERRRIDSAPITLRR